MAVPHTLKVLIADDHKAVRQMLASIVRDEPTLELVGEASDGLEAVRLSQQLHPEVVIIDLSMPRLSGVEAIRRIRAELPASRIIGLSMYEGEGIAYAVQAAGASAFINKCDAVDALLPTILQE